MVETPDDIEERQTPPLEKSDPIPFPDEAWFAEAELDRSLEVFDYAIGTERRKVAFWIESKNHAESRVILAEYQETDSLTGVTSTDTERFNDRMLQECVSYGDPPQKLSQKEIEDIKRNKKSGLYTALVFRVANRSDVVTPETIQKEKK